MNKTLIALIIALFLSNMMILSKIRDDIGNKRDELKKLRQEITQWEFVHENKDLQTILNQNRIIPLYSYTEAIKDTLSLFQRKGVNLGNADVKRAAGNAVDIRIDIGCSMDSFVKLMDLINNNENMIVVEEADMESRDGRYQAWRLKLKRYYNL